MPFDDTIPHGTLKGIRQHVLASVKAPRPFQPSEPPKAAMARRTLEGATPSSTRCRSSSREKSTLPRVHDAQLTGSIVENTWSQFPRQRNGAREPMDHRLTRKPEDKTIKYL